MVCDPLWEKVHFYAKYNIELRVKIAENGPLVVYLTRENYSLSSTCSHWSDVHAPLLTPTASPQGPVNGHHVYSDASVASVKK